MSTRYNIIAENEDGSFSRVYGQYDGYLDYTGLKLFTHYNTPELVRNLLSHGAIYVLDNSALKPDGLHGADNRQRGFTSFFKRDLNAGDYPAVKTKTLKEAIYQIDQNADYAYVYARHNGDNHPRWYLVNGVSIDALTPLETELSNNRLLLAKAA